MPTLTVHSSTQLINQQKNHFTSAITSEENIAIVCEVAVTSTKITRIGETSGFRKWLYWNLENTLSPTNVYWKKVKKRYKRFKDT